MRRVSDLGDSFTRFLEQGPRQVVLAVMVVIILIVGYLDYITPRELSLAVFNILPVLAIGWFVGKRPAIVLALVAGGWWFVAEELVPPSTTIPVPSYWNLLAKLTFFSVLAILITRLREASARERALARTDPLTGIANRRAFFEEADREIRRARRDGTPLSVALVDVDDFKIVNDVDGHEAGDEVLKQIAAALKGSTRSTDIVARIGGDEFAILLPNTPSGAAGILREKLEEAAAHLRRPSGGEVGVSAGIATSTGGVLSVDELLRDADADMYRAKRARKR